MMYSAYKLNRQDEAQARIKINGRNINYFTYAETALLWQKVKRN